jgi:hypothetical protein
VQVVVAQIAGTAFECVDGGGRHGRIARCERAACRFQPAWRFFQKGQRDALHVAGRHAGQGLDMEAALLPPVWLAACCAALIIWAEARRAAGATSNWASSASALCMAR